MASDWPLAKQPPQEHLVHSPAKPLAAIDRDHRHTLAVSGRQYRISVNVDQIDLQAVFLQKRFGVVA
jgi:hypothetical protein